MRTNKLLTCSVLLFLVCIYPVKSWLPTPHARPRKGSVSFTNSLRAAAASAIPAPEENASTDAAGEAEPAKVSKKELLKQKGYKEGGLFTFNTKYGFLNPYAIYYGITSIFLGLFWYAALWGCQLFYFLTGNRIDKRRRLVTFFSQVWGESLMLLARLRPEVEGLDKFKEFLKTNEAAMLVANHNSWLDIPFVGTLYGWGSNYKLVSKAELGKVPILGKAIKLGGHIMVDRSNRKSQIMTLRQGMDLLKNNVHLCTFPEGTRSKSGRISSFKSGAFKIAHKVGAPVIPVSIGGSAKAMPYYWMFPFRPSRGVAKVVIHEPISSKDKSEKELTEEVRAKIIEGLPEDQKPLDK